MQDLIQFQTAIQEGIPSTLPQPKPYDTSVSHAPKRNIDSLSSKEKRLALRNALRYFPKEQHQMLIPEFTEELLKYGRIYMYRYKPNYKITAKDLDSFPHKSKSAASISPLN